MNATITSTSTAHATTAALLFSEDSSCKLGPMRQRRAVLLTHGLHLQIPRHVISPRCAAYSKRHAPVSVAKPDAFQFRWRDSFAPPWSLRSAGAGGLSLRRRRGHETSPPSSRSASFVRMPRRSDERFSALLHGFLFTQQDGALKGDLLRLRYDAVAADQFPSAGFRPVSLMC
jgi:hypothetical protein